MSLLLSSLFFKGQAPHLVTLRHLSGNPSGVQLFEPVLLCRRVAIRPKLDARRISRKPKGYPERPVTLSEHLLKRRKELSLLQRQAAERLGVGHETYITWEKHGRSPEAWQWPKIIAFLGYDPYPQPVGLPDKIAAYRRRAGLTHGRLAELVGVHECTVQSWECGRHPPSRSGRAPEKLMALLS